MAFRTSIRILPLAASFALVAACGGETDGTGSAGGSEAGTGTDGGTTETGSSSGTDGGTADSGTADTTATGDGDGDGSATGDGDASTGDGDGDGTTDPCAALGREACAADDACQPIQGAPIRPVGDTMMWCFGNHEFIGCRATTAACPEVPTWVCMGDGQFLIDDGCVPEGFAECSEPTGMAGDCP